jgi:hypothetical protein
MVDSRDPTELSEVAGEEFKTDYAVGKKMEMKWSDFQSEWQHRR